MAILKMKKLRLLAVRSRKDALLRELIRKGCVEFSELEGQPEGSEAESFLNRESTKLMSFKSQLVSLNHAVALLDKYAPVKSKLLSAQPEVEQALLLDDSGVAGALKFAAAIETADDRIKRISAEESRQRSVVEALQPWLELDVPLNLDGTARTAVSMGTISAKLSLDEVDAALRQISEEAELFRINEDKSSHYVLLVCMKEDMSAMQECLRGFGFTLSALGGMNGSARKCLGEAEQSLRELAAEKKQCSRYIVGEAVRRDEIKLAADRTSTRIALAEAEEKLLGTDSVVVMEGWIPAENEKDLERVFEKYDCAWETCDPTEDEYPKVPVKLKNNKVTNALNMVTNMYSLPAYGSVDPNPLMAPFFILFYGLMMADVGYGLIMILAAVVAMAKIKPRGGTLSFCQLLLYGGIATTVMGALTGGFFGDAPYQIVHMIDPASTWAGMPSLFSPVRDSTTVLYGAMVLGVIHLNTGMVVSFVQKARAGNIADGIFEEGPLWVILVGGVLAVLGIGNIAGIPVLLIAGVLMLLFGAGRHSKGFGKVTAAFGCIYNTATGWFGDVLSYSRIMALMLAGGVVAQVFNTIAAMPAQNSGVNVFTVIAFVLIFLVGHALNFGLNLLGCFVHDLRLQCLEFFGKFYEDGGKPFAPLAIKTKYVKAKEN